MVSTKRELERVESLWEDIICRNSSAFDRRIKAVAIVASGLSLGDTLSDMLGKDGFINFLKGFNAARQTHYDTGEVQYIPAVATCNRPAAMTGDQPFEYYGVI